eukprot:3384592-Amphidinium_carterae.1
MSCRHHYRFNFSSDIVTDINSGGMIFITVPETVPDIKVSEYNRSSEIISSGTEAKKLEAGNLGLSPDDELFCPGEEDVCDWDGDF